MVATARVPAVVKPVSAVACRVEFGLVPVYVPVVSLNCLTVFVLAILPEPLT